MPLPAPVLPDYPASRWADPAADAGPPAPAPDAAATGRPAVVRTLAFGGVAVGLAALPYKLFELDRFFVPKEVALEVAAAVAIVAAGRLPAASLPARVDQPARWADRTDLALVAFLLASAVSAALAASPWLAARAVAVSVAGVALFWAARAAGRAGWAPPVLGAVAGLVAVAVGTALLQAYGTETEYFSLNRAPGGTFGNRNFVAHLCAIGLPVLAYLAVRARSAGAAASAVGTFGLAAATLVLTRSRAAWLATAAAAVPFALGVLRARAARRRVALPVGPDATPSAVAARRPVRDGVRLRRAVLLVLGAAAAALAAVRLPNALDWRSDSPYLDSARGMVNYREGSGQGRLKQWRNSARVFAAHPVLGVGPGHWSVHYPAAAPAGDPSLTSERTTANPWPSSDWVAFASERGLFGVVPLAAAMLFLLRRAHALVWRGATPDARLLGGALGAVAAATLTAGAFDAVLLLAAPSFTAWAALGALTGAADLRAGTAARPLPVVVRLTLAGVLAAGAALGAAHAVGMALYSTGRSRAVLRAASLAPSDYRILLRAAQVAQQTGQCADARRWGAATHTLAPSAPAAARVARGCGGR